MKMGRLQLLPNWDENKIELLGQFKILLLNRMNNVLGIYELSTGGVSGTIADPKLIFSAALKANASSIQAAALNQAVPMRC